MVNFRLKKESQGCYYKIKGNLTLFTLTLKVKRTKFPVKRMLTSRGENKEIQEQGMEVREENRF